VTAIARNRGPSCGQSPSRSPGLNLRTPAYYAARLTMFGSRSRPRRVTSRPP
jgi:hypothetical protein